MDGVMRDQLHCIGPDWFVSETVGYRLNPNGTRSRITKGQTYRTCVCGRVEESEWSEAYKKSLYDEGPEMILLYQRVLCHVTEHCAWLKDPEERKRYALRCIDSKAYEYWWKEIDKMTLMDFLEKHNMTIFELLQAIYDKLMPMGHAGIPINAAVEQFLDLEIVYEIRVNKDKYVLTKDDLDVLDLTMEDIKRIAHENRESDQFYAMPLHRLLTEGKGEPGVKTPIRDNQDLWAMGAMSDLYGAACITDSEFMQKVADARGADLILLPSSIHEILCLPDNGQIKLDTIKKMVQSVNMDDVVVPADEKLSDEVYYFSRAKKIWWIWNLSVR